MTYVDREVDRVRREAYIKLYNFLYTHLKRVDRIRVEEVRAMVREIVEEVYSAVVRDSYGVELSDFELTADVLADRLAREFTDYLAEQQRRVEKKIHRLTEFEMTERERKIFYEVCRGISSNDVEPVLRRVFVWRKSGVGHQTVRRRVERLVRPVRGRRSVFVAKSESVRLVETIQRELLLAGRIAGVFTQPVYALWVTSGKEKVCKECRYLNGRTVVLSKSFTSRAGLPVSSSPLHPECECRVYYVSGVTS